MKWLVTLIAVLASSAAIAQDDGRDPNWFRSYQRGERVGRSFTERDLRCPKCEPQIVYRDRYVYLTPVIQPQLTLRVGYYVINGVLYYGPHWSY